MTKIQIIYKMFRKFIIKPPEQTIWCITDSAKVIVSQITIFSNFNIYPITNLIMHVNKIAKRTIIFIILKNG